MFHKDERLKVRIGRSILAIGWSWEYGCYGVWLYGPKGPRRADGSCCDIRWLWYK